MSVRRPGGALLLAAAASVAAVGAQPMENRANQIVHASGKEARILWCDATANFARLSSAEAVGELVAKARRSGINALVVDVKDLTGRVLYDSKIAPRLEEYDGVRHPDGFDLLSETVRKGHEQGLAVYASMNVFSEGRVGYGGPVYEHPEWESVNYTNELWAQAEGAQPYPVAYLNKTGLDGRLALLESGKGEAPEAAQGLVCVQVGRQDGSAVALEAPASPPEGHYLLFGSGDAGKWLLGAAAAGCIDVTGRPKMISARNVKEMHQAIFVNPANEDVRRYELSVAREIASNYDVDGIVLDRMRYPGLDADFGGESRHLFEAWLGREVENWPQDIMSLGTFSDVQDVWGPLFPKWIEWRAQVLKSFLAEVRAVVKVEDPGKEVAAYVGSWYWSYYPLGPNWASDKFRPATAWASPDYSRTGYAPLTDFIMTGCYYPTVSREEARQKGTSPGATVEAACQGSVNVIGSASFTYGSLYLLDYKDDTEQFDRAIQMCRQATQGVMLFDLVYLEQYGWWDVLAASLGEPKELPHQDENLREQLRASYKSSY